MSRPKIIRENLKLIREEFEKNQIKDWFIEGTAGNHVKITFYRHGKPLILVFAPSTERHAMKNNVSTVRRLIRDADSSACSNQGQPVLCPG